MMTEPLPRILVIDDEQHQLDTVCRGLHLFGYRCQGMPSVETALAALASAAGDGFDLVLTDLTMPGRSGLALIEHVRREWPDLPIVVITGLAATSAVGIVREMNLPLLQKPFDPKMLAATISRALNQDRQQKRK